MAGRPIAKSWKLHLLASRHSVQNELVGENSQQAPFLSREEPESGLDGGVPCQGHVEKLGNPAIP